MTSSPDEASEVVCGYAVMFQPKSSVSEVCMANARSAVVKVSSGGVSNGKANPLRGRLGKVEDIVKGQA